MERLVDQNNSLQISAEQYENIANIQQQILAKLAADEAILAILNALCSLAEKLLPNSVASIMLLDKKTGLMNVLCAPSIPPEGHQALANLKPGPHGGSCGNAVFHNEAQFVDNTFKDERWQNLRHIAYDFNLCACWSMPIRDKKGHAIGSFALSSFEHRAPAPFHCHLLATCAAIVSIVLKKQRREKRLQLLSTALLHAQEGVVVTDKDLHILEVNPAFEKIYGYQAQEVIGKTPKILKSGLQDQAFYRAMWQQLNQQDAWHGEIINKHKNGSYVTQWMSISVIRDEQGEIQNYLSVFSNLTELKLAQKKIVDMAFTDEITGLYNKTYLEQQLENSDLDYSLILLNINNFSYINTTYGFDFGDKILINIAEQLKNNFSCHSLYRLNSDEFALLFEGKIDLEAQIKSIQSLFYHTFIDVDGVSLCIAFTLGAVYGRAHLLRKAALALKQARSLGKNRFYILDETENITDSATREYFISTNLLLRNALAEDRVIPYFQGIYHNNSQKITKFEVLVRIKEKDEILTPYHFLETAKLSGLLPEITRVMIDKSFSIMANYRVDFSINITEDDLSQNFLIDYLAQKTQQYNIAPQRIILEILEGVSATGKKNHIKQLTQLKNQGYRLAIDDFGTEYSNFERILDLEIDLLKLDAKYIKHIDTDKKSYEIAQAIAFFAHRAGIACVAEFVHCESVQKVVQQLGIDYSQGYYFSEPAPYPLIAK